MKFVICAVVVCALSMNAQASVLPLALNAPVLYSTSAFGPRITIDRSHSIAVHDSIIPAESHLYRAPLFVQSPVAWNSEGTYIAKTLGSEHVTSLPGHLNSAASINLEKAPGTDKDENKDSTFQLPSSVAIHGSVIPATLPLTYAPLIVRAPIAPIVIPSEATYVAKNLGVEHIAPLPGHTISATSLNLEPAPGSKEIQ